MVREVVTYVLLLAALLAAPLMVVGEAFAQSPQFGVVTQVFSSQDDSKVTQLGAGSVRLSANWNEIELCSSRVYGPSCFSWAALDDAMNRAIARQLEVVLSLAYTPAWSNSNGPNWMPGDMLDWQNFVEAIINRYGNYPYLVFGIWNEPNLDQFLMDDNYATFWATCFSMRMRLGTIRSRGCDLVVPRPAGTLSTTGTSTRRSAKQPLTPNRRMS